MHKAATVAILAAFLVSCASSPPPASTPAASATPGTGSSRYEMEHDSPLLEPFDLSRVKPVIPVVERRTIAGNKSPYTVNGVTYRVMDSEVGYSDTGRASWYGRKFHGHRTSNGEVYDMFQLSAAHRSLPIPSFAKVTNLENGRSVVVRINDRGPFHRDRIIDLSYAGATLLGFAEAGTARVRVEAIVPGQQPPVMVAGSAMPAPGAMAARPLPGGGEYLQVGAFSNLESAHGVLPRLATITSVPAFVRSEPGNSGMLHRVRLGPLDDSVDLDGLIKAIVDANLGMPFRIRQ